MKRVGDFPGMVVTDLSPGCVEGGSSDGDGVG